MPEPLYIYSGRDTESIIIDAICIANNINKKTFNNFTREGMPNPRNGASFDECQEWYYQNKFTDVELAKALDLRPAKVQMLKKKGMPTPKQGVSIEEIKLWVKNHFKENISTYGMEKT